MADYTRWANRDTRRSFSGFLQESGQFLSGDPAEIANQKGWTGDNFGWYRDQSGQVVARSVGGKMVVYDGSAPSSTPMTTDMGNPAITAGQKPAERARTMGLQSNGKGGYVDDSGQVVARTVNGELVFYDDKGGAVSDGAGGQALTQSSPSWVDPDSGLILVPPAQPETPEEKASTPDPIPATPPMGFDLFLTQKHKKAKADAEAQRQAEAEQQQQEQQVAEFYQSDEVMARIHERAMQMIDMAEKSGDEAKMATATHMKDMLQQFAPEVQKYTQAVEDPKGKLEVGVELLKRMVSNAQYMQRRDAGETMGESDVDVEKEAAYSIPTVMKYQEKMPNASIPGKEQKIEGEKTVWTLSIDGKVREGALDRSTPEASDLPQNNNLEAAMANNYEPGQSIEINWDVKDDNKEAAVGEKADIAMDAFKTWKRDILPLLPVGSICYALPADTRLEKIYKLAGFDRNAKDKNEFEAGRSEVSGVVTIDENGNKKMVPYADSFDPNDDDDDTKMEAYLYNMWEPGINMLQEQLTRRICFS